MTRLIIILMTLVALGLAAWGSWWYLNQEEADGDITLAIDCGENSTDFALCQASAAAFSRQTGYTVAVKKTPNNASLHLELLKELIFTESEHVDVYSIDVVWPGELSADLLDLNPYFTSSELSEFFPRIIENNSVDGRLLAIPYYTDAGLLYYREDLLSKYNFSGPPQTWDELERMASTIQAGERAEGNNNFWGYVWQGAQYEGLTCDALEWIASENGGGIIEADGSISVNNENVVRALERAQGWVGTITPENVTELTEESSRAIWQDGNAAFMRNWPYAYSLGNQDGSVIAGQFDVSPLPSGSGDAAATLGGWQLAVSKYSKHPEEAAELVRYFTSEETQKIRAIEGAFNPTRRALYQDAEVLATNPFFSRMPIILDAAVARPSTVTGEKYTDVSTTFNSAIHRMLKGELTPQGAVSSIETTLSEIRADGW